jgi:hypothetical protein
MIKLQFTTITGRIRNKIRNGNWFPKFSINSGKWRLCVRPNDRQTFLLLGAVKNQILSVLVTS